MRRSVKVVYHAVARRLADALQVLSPGLTPLVRVTRVAAAH